VHCGKLPISRVLPRPSLMPRHAARARLAAFRFPCPSEKGPGGLPQKRRPAASGSGLQLLARRRVKKQRKRAAADGRMPGRKTSAGLHPSNLI